MSVRIERLRERMRARGHHAFFSVSPPDNQYLTGLVTSLDEISSALLITEDRALFLCDSRYTEQAQEEVCDYEIVEIRGDQLVRSGEHAAGLHVASIAYDPAALTIDDLERFKQGLDSENFAGQLTPDKTCVSELRVCKDAAEIDRIRTASQLAEGVLPDLLPEIHEGMTEQELAARFEFEFKKRGAMGPSFDTIALFGPRSSLPHGIPGDRTLKQGDVVLLDFGVRRQGYCSDLTRTFAFGTIPGSWFQEIYDLSLTAQVAALEAVRPGARCRDVDAVARDIIRQGGYGDRFGHGLGHGVGIEIHEAPRVNTESESVLEEGMVITVEPGIYLPGQGGVRIEDLVVLTSAGCEVLTRTSKELQVLDA